MGEVANNDCYQLGKAVIFVLMQVSGHEGLFGDMTNKRWCVESKVFFIEYINAVHNYTLPPF